MKNYYDRQRNSTLTQIDHLYREKDVTFRGFRHSAGKGMTGEANETKQKAINVQGNEIMDGLVNWEGSQTSDGERFAQEAKGLLIL